MCEEVQKPATQVPKAMVGTIMFNTIMGIIFLVPLLFVFPDQAMLAALASGRRWLCWRLFCALHPAARSWYHLRYWMHNSCFKMYMGICPRWGHPRIPVVRHYLYL
jgi:hypothetical protein